MNGRAAWQRLGTGGQVVVVLIGAVVVVNLALAALDSATRGRDDTGPRSSSFATAPAGAAAYSELLQRYGHPTEGRRGAPGDAALDPAETVVVLDPDELARDDVGALRAFVRAGGRLVGGGGDPTWLRDIAPRVPDWQPSGGRRPHAVVDGATYALHTAGEGSFTDAPGSELVTSRVGAGTVVALADTSPVQNRLLGDTDNAAFGVALAGRAGRRVVFAEGVHGYGTATGLAAIPDRWKLAIAGAALAALVAMLAAGRRIGPAEDDVRSLPPARQAYVDALAASLARTRPRGEALRPMQAAVRARLAARAALAPGAGDGDLERAARALGWPEDEITSLGGDVGNDDRALALGRALARIERVT